MTTLRITELNPNAQYVLHGTATATRNNTSVESEASETLLA